MTSRRDAEEKIAEFINKVNGQKPMSFEQKEGIAVSLILAFEQQDNGNPELRFTACTKLEEVFGKDWWV